MRLVARYPLLASTLTLFACQQQSAPTPSSLKPTASIQEVMASIVDPAADVLWESVGTTISLKGVEDREPRTPEQWQTVRSAAVTLIESANLLMMDGRHIVQEGGKLTDEGLEGVLTAREAQKKIDAQRPAFIQFARSLQVISEQMLSAIDAKNPQAIMELGTKLDEVCEACHTTFWYPGAAAVPQVK